MAKLKTIKHVILFITLMNSIFGDKLILKGEINKSPLLLYSNTYICFSNIDSLEKKLKDNIYSIGYGLNSSHNLLDKLFINMFSSNRFDQKKISKKKYIDILNSFQTDLSNLENDPTGENSESHLSNCYDLLETQRINKIEKLNSSNENLKTSISEIQQSAEKKLKYKFKMVLKILQPIKKYIPKIRLALERIERQRKDQKDKPLGRLVNAQLNQNRHGNVNRQRNGNRNRNVRNGFEEVEDLETERSFADDPVDEINEKPEKPEKPNHDVRKNKNDDFFHSKRIQLSDNFRDIKNMITKSVDKLNSFFIYFNTLELEINDNITKIPINFINCDYLKDVHAKSNKIDEIVMNLRIVNFYTGVQHYLLKDKKIKESEADDKIYQFDSNFDIKVKGLDIDTENPRVQLESCRIVLSTDDSKSSNVANIDIKLVNFKNGTESF